MPELLIKLAEKGSLKKFQACLAERSHPPEVLEEAMRYALVFPQAKKVALLLEAGTDPLARNREDAQFLTHAVVGGNPELVERMLALGCDPNHRATTGRTPLHNAAYGGKAAAIGILLKAGADPKVTDNQGWTPLLDALRNRNGCEAALLLIEADADPEARSPGEQRTALMLAALGKQEPCARRLIERGADLEATDFIGCRPLMHAAMQGGAAMVRLLLEAGADPQARDHQGRTAFRWASPLQPEIGQILLRATRISPEERLHNLVEAAAKSHVESVRELLAQGAPVQAAAEGGESALIAAVGARDSALLPLLLEQEKARVDYRSGGVLITALMSAVGRQRPEARDLLLDAGADPEITDHHGGTAAHIAARRADLDSLQQLQARGARLDVLDRAGQSLLHHACTPESSLIADAEIVGVIDWLLAQGAAVDCLDRNGCTPLMRSADQARAAIAAHLIARGAEVNRRDFRGDTALSRAVGVGADFGYNDRYIKPRSCKQDRVYPLIEVLIDAGADPRLFGSLGDPVQGAKLWRCPQAHRRLKACNSGSS